MKLLDISELLDMAEFQLQIKTTKLFQLNNFEML